MAHNPKLEIFKIHLGTEHGTFRTLREQLFPKIESTDLFNQFFIRFITDIDKPDFVKNTRLQKGLTAYNTSNSETSPISFSSDNYIIEGTFDGGKFGSIRTKSSVNNKQELESLSEDKIVMDKYYFLLYAPDTSKKGFLFVQNYSGDNVTDVFKGFIEKFLTAKPVFKKPIIEKYVPPIFVKEFLEGSVLKKFNYSETMLIPNLSGTLEAETNHEFVVRIELESKSGLPNNSLNKILASLGIKKFNNKQLQEFHKGKVHVQNVSTKKSHPFEMNNEFDVKPVIFLDGRVNIGQGGRPDFDELKKYCRTILTSEIIPSEYTINAIHEH